jgi:hypothetical protein
VRELDVEHGAGRLEFLGQGEQVGDPEAEAEAEAVEAVEAVEGAEAEAADVADVAQVAVAAEVAEVAEGTAVVVMHSAIPWSESRDLS